MPAFLRDERSREAAVAAAEAELDDLPLEEEDDRNGHSDEVCNMPPLVIDLVDDDEPALARQLDNIDHLEAAVRQLEESIEFQKRLDILIEAAPAFSGAAKRPHEGTEPRERPRPSCKYARMEIPCSAVPEEPKPEEALQPGGAPASSTGLTGVPGFTMHTAAGGCWPVVQPPWAELCWQCMDNCDIHGPPFS